MWLNTKIMFLSFFSFFFFFPALFTSAALPLVISCPQYLPIHHCLVMLPKAQTLFSHWVTGSAAI